MPPALKLNIVQANNNSQANNGVRSVRPDNVKIRVRLDYVRTGWTKLSERLAARRGKERINAYASNKYPALTAA